MKKIFILAASCMILFSCSDKKKDDKTGDGKEKVAGVSDTKPATELLEISAGDAVKNSFAAFAKGDVDGMVTDFDDNIRYTWSNGDSLVGKQAVKDYYKGRWDLIQSINFSKQIVLPLQVNESQQPDVAPPGKWILYWHTADVTYKNGKSIQFWSHSVNHVNDAGKIDFIGMYMDRHQIIEATKDLMPK